MKGILSHIGLCLSSGFFFNFIIMVVDETWLVKLLLCVFFIGGVVSTGLLAESEYKK